MPEEIVHEWSFGSDELAKKLKQLVLSGKKTATAGLYKEGQLDMILLFWKEKVIKILRNGERIIENIF